LWQREKKKGRTLLYLITKGKRRDGDLLFNNSEGEKGGHLGPTEKREGENIFLKRQWNRRGNTRQSQKSLRGRKKKKSRYFLLKKKEGGEYNISATIKRTAFSMRGGLSCLSPKCRR